MLILRRKLGQWTRATDHAGDALWIRAHRIYGPFGEIFEGAVELAFDDPRRNYEITRDELIPRSNLGTIPARRA
jgi:hypothetical protein